MSHSSTHPGLQSHSVGELYPWSVVVIDNAASGEGYCIARNLVTGENLTRFPYYCRAEGDFERQHAAAENEARERIALDGKGEIVTAADHALLAKLFPRVDELGRELTILIPRKRDSDRGEHSAAAWAEWESFLFSNFGGYTADRNRLGAWQAPSGERTNDELVAFIVAGDAGKCDRLFAALPRFAVTFDQQCIYVAESSPRARLFWAS